MSFNPTFSTPPKAAVVRTPVRIGTQPATTSKRKQLLVGIAVAIPLGVVVGLFLSTHALSQQPQPITQQLLRDDCDSLYQQGYIDWPLVPGSDTETVDSFSLGDVMPEGTRYKRIRTTTIYKQKPSCNQDRAMRLEQQKKFLN